MNQPPFVFPGRLRVQPAGAPFPVLPRGPMGSLQPIFDPRGFGFVSPVRPSTGSPPSSTEVEPTGTTPAVPFMIPDTASGTGSGTHQGAPAVPGTPTTVGAPIDVFPRRSVSEGLGLHPPDQLIFGMITCAGNDPNRLTDPQVRARIFLNTPYEIKKLCLAKFFQQYYGSTVAYNVTEDIIWNTDLYALGVLNFVLRPTAFPSGGPRPAIPRLALGEVLQLYNMTCQQWVSLSPAYKQAMILNQYTQHRLPMYIESLAGLVAEADQGCWRVILQQYNDQYARGDVSYPQYAAYASGQRSSTPWNR